MTRRWRFACLLGLLAFGDRPSPAQGPALTIPPPPLSAFDHRLDPIHQALAIWDTRKGPDRQVVDQVCLVPDLPTFFEAIASWDEKHYFPVLFDEVETSFRFIRAFKPARIVRMPRTPAALRPEKVWDRAIETVGASWTSADTVAPRPTGLVVPRALGATPPGVVFTGSTAPMLAGAVALAAGRFQPMIRLDSEKRFADVLTPEQADAFARTIARRVGERRPNSQALGDDCDFITLAVDLPYRYKDSQGDALAVDDRLGRIEGSDRRWAFVGRLLGDPAESTYRAMCSLFLEPESAALFNSYDDSTMPWAFYTMRRAALRLNAIMPTIQVSDEDGGLAGWHETFDPANRFGLVMVNTMGGPNYFELKGRKGYTSDIPVGAPTVVLIVHSFSAADPTDQATLAGRWLANGAYLYYGAMNEPYLDAFRTPQVVTELIGRGFPVVAAVRQLPGESRAMPWKLAYLGDPLYRIRKGAAPERLARWDLTATWPAYAAGPRPAAGDARPNASSDLLFWTLRAALAGLQAPAPRQTQVDVQDLADALLSIRRDQLAKPLRLVYDVLLIDILFEAKKRSTLKARLLAIPPPERLPAVTRAIEAIRITDFSYALAMKDVPKLMTAWHEILKSDLDFEIKSQSVGLIESVPTTPEDFEQWRAALKTAVRERPAAPEAKRILDELKRVEAELAKVKR